MKRLTETDLETILNGAALLGSGGGGPRAIGDQIIKAVKKSGRPVEVAAPEEIGDDDWLAIAAGIGSPDSVKNGFDFAVVTAAYKDLAAELGVEFKAVMAAEIGSGNTFMPMWVASDMGIPVVDGAGASRAVPSITMNSFAAAGIDVAHLMLATEDRKVGLSVKTAAEAAGPLRAVISDPSFGQVAGIALWAMRGATMKSHIIPGTITDAREAGSTLATLHCGEGWASAAASALHGRLLGVGRITEASESTAGGFDMGRVTFSIGDGVSLVVLNKNENLIAWRSDRTSPVAIGPDLICYLASDGTAFSNAELVHGSDVAVIALPAGSKMRDDFIVAQFRAALLSLGYPGPCLPLNSLS